MPDDFGTMVNQSYSTPPKYSEIQAGVPEDFADIRTLGDLLSINYKLIDSKEQLRKNLISKMRSGEPRYPGIIGFDDDVIPALDRAILSKHDVFLVGQIGQAKTKIVQTIAETLLSPIPIIRNSLTNDCPLELPQEELISLLEDKEVTKQNPTFHISPESSDQIRDDKLDTAIEWVNGKNRFKYVLATPDISVKDLVGYLDAIKVAKKGIEMYKIDSYSPGQLMQAKHGIFCIDELPVLDPRKQVALLSVLQEGRFTTGSYPVIFEPKITFFATANPIDYTHSGKVIEPLYDRLKSHIHTHYPNSLIDEMMIILQEAKVSNSLILSPILSTLTKIIQKTRCNSQVNQERGVSVRLGVHGLELLVGEAERTRSISHSLLAVPRISDLHCLTQVAKFEISEMDDTIENRHKLFSNIINESIKETCIEFLGEQSTETLNTIKQEFGENMFPISQKMLWVNGQSSLKNQIDKFPNLKKLVDSKMEDIQNLQTQLLEKISSNRISTNSLKIDENSHSEISALLVEMILEGLCWTEPKTLDRREAGYAAS